MKVLDLGCGKRKLKGAVGVDILEYDGVDVVHDLNKFPYPFKDEEFDVINCDNVLEHLDNITDVLRELWRVTKLNGKIVIKAPHFSNFWAFSDPTHKHFFGYKSFEYYCGLQQGYLNLFSIKERKIGFGTYFRVFEYLFNKFPDLYENRFAFLIQAAELSVVLVKNNMP